ncbi:MAG: 5-formyltetrahydrofolate cyclo-ligase [Pseudomonadota bacterium]
MGINLPNLADQKADLRKRCYARRIAIDAADYDLAAKAVAASIDREVDIDASAIVAAYWPLPGELDPRPALNALIKRGAAGALPRMVGDGKPVVFHEWKPGDRLLEGRFKVMEPATEAAVVSPTVVLVPLLAFDMACRRLGHGKGYYDRTIQALKESDPGVRAVGVAFAAQEVERVPTDAYDQTLDMVITERAVHRP